MGVTGRQRQQLSLRLSAPSVAEAVAVMRARRRQAGQRGLRLKAGDDGRLTARVPGGRNSSTPCLRGHFEQRDGHVVLEGVISESPASVSLPRGFTGMGLVLAIAAILLAVAGQPSPGSYICGVATVLFGLIGYGLGRLRTGSFRYDCKDLTARLIPLLPGARPPDEDAGGVIRRLP